MNFFWTESAQNKAIDAALIVGNAIWSSEDIKHCSLYSKPRFRGLPNIHFWISSCTCIWLSWTQGSFQELLKCPYPIRSIWRTWYNTLLQTVIAYHPCQQSRLLLNSGTLWTWFTVTSWAALAQTWILYYRRVAPASAVGVIFLWNNPANPMGGMLG